MTNTPVFRHVALVALFIPATALAQPFEDLGTLQGNVVAALGAEIGEPGGPARPLDQRLKLAACPEPAIVDAPALGAVAVRCPSLGWRIRVTLVRAAGATLAAKAEPVVRRGDLVELRAAGGAFSISMTATAEEDGAPGDRVRVRADRKATPVIAQVEGPGRVSLPGFK